MKFDIALPNCMEGFLVPANFLRNSCASPRKPSGSATTPFGVSTSPPPSPISEAALPDGAEPNWYELMITLASLSGVTKTIKLGAGVVIIPLRDPVILAKQSATLGPVQQRAVPVGLGPRRLSRGVRHRQATEPRRPPGEHA